MDIQPILQEHALTILGLMGTGMMTLMGVIATMGRLIYKQHSVRTEKLSEALIQLSQALEKTQKETRKDHERIAQSVQGLRAELHLTNNNLEHTKHGMTRMEGILENQQTLISENIRELTRVSEQLKAVFRFIDKSLNLPKRATDV